MSFCSTHVETISEKTTQINAKHDFSIYIAKQRVLGKSLKFGIFELYVSTVF